MIEVCYIHTFSYDIDKERWITLISVQHISFSREQHIIKCITSRKIQYFRFSSCSPWMKPQDIELQFNKYSIEKCIV